MKLFEWMGEHPALAVFLVIMTTDFVYKVVRLFIE